MPRQRRQNHPCEVLGIVIVDEQSVMDASVQPFQVRKVPERSFFARVFGGSRSSDAEAAVENLIAERGLDNMDIAAIDNCLHQSGVREKAMKTVLLNVWRHAVERFVATDGTLDSAEAVLLDRLKSVLGLDATTAYSARDSVLANEFVARARPLISGSDGTSEETGHDQRGGVGAGIATSSRRSLICANVRARMQRSCSSRS
jgi:hypothetical protein